MNFPPKFLIIMNNAAVNVLLHPGAHNGSLRQLSGSRSVYIPSTFLDNSVFLVYESLSWCQHLVLPKFFFIFAIGYLCDGIGYGSNVQFSI